MAQELGRRSDAGLAWRSLQKFASAALALAGASSRRDAGRCCALSGTGRGSRGAGRLAALISLGATRMLALLATSGRLRLAAAAGRRSLDRRRLLLPARPAAGARPPCSPARAHWLGVLAWWLPAERKPPAAASAGAPRFARAGIGVSLFAVLLGVANLGIRDKETLIRDGRPVFVELAPVDPRSLMQGDFMRLNFNVPGELAEQRSGHAARAAPARGGVSSTNAAWRACCASPTASRCSRANCTSSSRQAGTLDSGHDAWFFAEGERSAGRVRATASSASMRRAMRCSSKPAWAGSANL